MLSGRFLSGNRVEVQEDMQLKETNSIAEMDIDIDTIVFFSLNQ